MSYNILKVLVLLVKGLAHNTVQAALQAVRDSLIETERNHVHDHQILAEEVSEERRQCEEAEVGHTKERMEWCCAQCFATRL